MKMELWATRVKVLVLSGLFASIANFINTWKAGKPVSPRAAIPALVMMFVLIVASYYIQELVAKFVKFPIPTILYTSLITIICTIPNFLPFSNYMLAEFAKVGLLPLCTPILAYAGVAVGKDMDDFKRQGVAIVCVALITFFGTYVGSAIIAEVLLRATGVI
jgi:putative effector of murein hydrolase LrgA (UPF0299 family)